MTSQPHSSVDEQSRNSSLLRARHPFPSPSGTRGTFLIFWSLLPSQSCFFSCCRNCAGAEESRSGLQIQRHSHKDLARCTAASVFAPRLCLCLFFVVKLNGQNFKYVPPSDSEIQQTVERAAQCVPGPFYLLWTAVGWEWFGLVD